MAGEHHYMGEISQPRAPAEPRVELQNEISGQGIFYAFTRDSFRRYDDGDSEAEMKDALEQSLQSWHSQLIALGSAIGTGLFIGVGQGLAISGPLPLLAAFAFVGFTLLPTIFALGEMATLMPLPGAFVLHSKLFIGETWAATMGWNYAFQWLITLPLELVASSITLQYWGLSHKIKPLFITIFLGIIILVNIAGVRSFGNVEAFFSILKVIAVVGFIILGVFIDLGLGFGGHATGVSYWYNPGAGHNGWVGFSSVLIITAFAYSGTETVGLTAAEQNDHINDMPKAIKKVFLRIGLFYIASVLVIGMIVRYDDPGLLRDQSDLVSATSPFVIAVKNAGIQVLPSMLNSIVLVTVLSVANASSYGSSRVLSAMADAGMAPQIFGYIDRKGRPLYAFLLSLVFGLLAYLGSIPQQTTVFIWLLALCGLSSVVSWASICLTHIYFRYALQLQGIDLRTLPYRSQLGVVGSCIGLVCNSLIILCQCFVGIFPVGYEKMSGALRAQAFFEGSMFIWLLILFFGLYKFFKNTETVAIGEIDFSDTWTNDTWQQSYILEHPPQQENAYPSWVPKPVQWALEQFAFPW